MNSKSASIYELSKRAEEEEMEREARSIANAYRKVQQLPARARESKKEQKKETSVKSNGQSAYAAKVKQALKEINASKAKQMEELSKCLPQRHEPPRPNNPATKLQKAAATKILNVLQQQERRVFALCMRQLRQWWEAEEKREGDFFRKWKLLRWLKAWRKEAKVSRAIRVQKEQQQAVMQRQSLQLASEFRTFSLLKKTLRAWHVLAKREARRRAHQNLLVVQQISAQQVQKKEKTRGGHESKVAQENSALQQKVRGFLDGLKQKVTHQDRLRTIKEKTEQSRPNEEPPQETLSNQPHQETQMAVDEIQEGQMVVMGVQPQKKQMTGDQLERRRKQLEAKHKSRKEALQRLRQEKEGRRKEEEAQRIEAERQLQAEQRRIKQEKYKQYIRNKNEEAAWQRRQAQLTIMADQFNATRLQKYYGLLPWASVRARCRQKIAFLHQTILLIMFRLRGNQFMANLAEVASKKVEKLMQSMDIRYGRALLRRSLKAIRHNCLAERVAKEQYRVMHQVNSLKIVLCAWKSVRGQLAGQNYEWQKPRMKRAEEYYRMQLKHKAFKSMVTNREERKRETCIEQQKKLIKGKIEMLLQKNEEIDYNQYL